ncbi:MAG TPA: Na-translocating system protein MpsC family protein [Solirubrobacteraceae bacterium]|jgi:uncharacterized protein YbcI|nr:Na-translocating system protein MpsC family protein [Solirubrobacteraceae bacterium]
MTGNPVPPESLPGPKPDSLPGSKASAISNLTVRMMSLYTGRGPTKARTHFNEDLVYVVLADTLTKGEHTLVANGYSEMVLATRKTFQDTMSAELVAGVEHILGRTVIAFLSTNHIDPDVAIETFILAPTTHPAAEEISELHGD